MRLCQSFGSDQPLKTKLIPATSVINALSIRPVNAKVHCPPLATLPTLCFPSCCPPTSQCSTGSSEAPPACVSVMTNITHSSIKLRAFLAFQKVHLRCFILILYQLRLQYCG